MVVSDVRAGVVVFAGAGAFKDLGAVVPAADVFAGAGVPAHRSATRLRSNRSRVPPESRADAQLIREHIYLDLFENAIQLFLAMHIPIFHICVDAN